MGSGGLSAERLLMALLLGGVAIGCVLVLRPFLSAILWAAILAFTTWPMFEYVRNRAHTGRTGTAAIMVAIVAVVVVLPLALAAPGGADDAERLRRLVQDAAAAGLPQAPA